MPNPYLMANPTPVSTTTATAVTITAGSAAGDAIVVAASTPLAGACAPAGVTDTKGNGYLLATPVLANLGTWIADGPTPLTTSDKPTVTWSTNGTSTKDVIVVGVPGAAASGALDPATASSNGTGTAISVTSGTPGAANCIALLVISNSSSGGVPSSLGSFTSLGTVELGGFQYLTVAYQILSAATPVTGSATITSTAWTANLLIISPTTAVTGTAGVLVGATVEAGSYGGSLSADIATWTGSVINPGRSLQSIRVFFGPGNIPATAAAAGLTQHIGVRRVLMSFKPGLVGSGNEAANKASLNTLLADCKAQGLDAKVALYHEPDSAAGLTASQYKTMIQYYSATVRTYYPLVYCKAAYRTHVDPASPGNFYPGDAFVDECAYDFYEYDWRLYGQTMDSMAVIADGGGKPLSAWELGVVVGGVGGTAAGSPGAATHAQGTAYMQYVTNYFVTRRAAGKPIGDVSYYDYINAASNWDHVIQPGTYLAPLYDALYDSLQATGPTGGGISSTAVGTFLNPTNMSEPSMTQAISDWNSWTGVTPLAVTRSYYALSSFPTTDANLTLHIANGTKVCLNLSPAFNPTSGTDLTNLNTMLSSWKTAGLKAEVSLWAEPFNAGLSAGQFQAMIAFYGPTVRTYYPLVFCTSALSAQSNSENTYYTSDADFDKIATDLYAVRYLSGTRLDTAATIADNAVPRKPFGLWEFGAHPQGSNFLVGDNTNFDATAGTWTGAGNCTTSRVTTPTHAGAGALQLLDIAGPADMTAASCAAANITTQGIPCTSGDLIPVTAWVRTQTTARSVQAGAGFYTSGGVLVSSLFDTGNALTDSTSYQKLSGQVTAPATAAFARAMIKVLAGATNELHFIDDVTIGNLSTGQTQADVTTYWNYLDSYFTARRTAGKPNADLIHFNSGSATDAVVSPITPATGASDYRIALWQTLRTDLSATASPAQLSSQIDVLVDVSEAVTGGTSGTAPGGTPAGSSGIGWPQLTVEAGMIPAAPVVPAGTFILGDSVFGKLGTGRLGPSTAWTDLAGLARSITIVRPSSRVQGPLTDYQPATITVTFDNSDGRFDPDNTSGPYANPSGGTLIRPMLPIRVRAQLSGTGSGIGYGFADGWNPSPVTYEGGYAELVMTATDAFKVLGGRTVAAAPLTGDGENSGARIHRILDAAGWYTDHRNVAAGDTQVQGTTMGDTALSLMQLTARTEIGDLYADGSGNVVFRDRHAILTDTRSNTSQALFGDADDGTELNYASVTRASDDTTLANDVQITRNGGTVQESTNPASITTYLFPRTWADDTVLLLSDTEAKNYAQWVRYVSQAEDKRFEQITIDPLADTVKLFPQVLGRDIGDRITVRMRPANAGTVTRDCFIRGIQHDIDCVNYTWLTTWTLQDAGRYSGFLILGDAVFGQLDHNALAY